MVSLDPCTNPTHHTFLWLSLCSGLNFHAPAVDTGRYLSTDLRWGWGQRRGVKEVSLSPHCGWTTSELFSPAPFGCATGSAGISWHPELKLSLHHADAPPWPRTGMSTVGCTGACKPEPSLARLQNILADMARMGARKTGRPEIPQMEVRSLRNSCACRCMLKKENLVKGKLLKSCKGCRRTRFRRGDVGRAWLQGMKPLLGNNLTKQIVLS